MQEMTIGGQLEQAALIATLRHVGVPLATVREWLELDPAELAGRVTRFWREAESQHAAQRKLVGIVRDQRLPRMPGRAGAAFCIYWGEVSADSDGPVEWCKPVPDAEAEALAAQVPELTLRVEPAHREAYVDLGPGGQIDAAQFQLADQALRTWASEHGIIDSDQLTLQPEDLGVRITYLASGPPTETSAPDCDFAVPFA